MSLRQVLRQHREEARLRRQLRSTLRRAGIAEPTDMLEVCERLSAIWPVPIVAAPFDLPAHGPFGLTIRYAPEPQDEAIYILYQRVATPLHQQHVVAHELGHVLGGHPLDPVDDLSEIDPNGSTGTLRRTSYNSRVEREAETIATVLLGRAAARDGVTLPSNGARDHRLRRVLGDKVEWL
ncbi:hypothetical protein FHX42_001573 [Saccharopolyspora lacisalsi]|uniref:IrrE N-terminal-like domain-containing protein n=1 Tax=Halosaccharopolyspora lacisalsi TaxID=1000566 RepID=A0A839DRV4_9PSEU|nr:hypothetical protein [Halosaccharopolyspora lacisalsi]MBA8824244.1 hypothetical protein [Halosaccharopolyspora lacisalsi]